MEWEKQCNLWQSLTMLDRFFSLNTVIPEEMWLYPRCYAKAVWIFGFHWVGFYLWEDIAKGRLTAAGFTWEATLSLQSCIPVYYFNHILLAVDMFIIVLKYYLHMIKCTDLKCLVQWGGVFFLRSSLLKIASFYFIFKILFFFVIVVCCYYLVIKSCLTLLQPHGL